MLAYTRAVNVDAAGRKIGSFDQYLTTPGASSRPEERFRRLLAELLGTAGLSVLVYQFGLIRRRALDRTRLFGNFIGADLRLISELILAGPFVEIPDELLEIRAHEGSSSFGEATSSSEAMHAFINPGTPDNPEAPRPAHAGRGAEAWAPGSGVIHSPVRRFPAFVEAILRSPLDPRTRLLLAAETTGHARGVPVAGVRDVLRAIAGAVRSPGSPAPPPSAAPCRAARPPSIPGSARSASTARRGTPRSSGRARSYARYSSAIPSRTVHRGRNSGSVRAIRLQSTR